MIIGENTDQYYGYEEESYDYLFKKKQGAPSRRQQKKTERKANKPAPRPGSLKQKRQDKKAGIAPKKRLIMGNFGLFNKNKKKEEAAKAAATQDVITPPDADNLPDASALDESPQDQEMNNGADTAAFPASEENPDAGAPAGAEGEDASESGYDDPPSTPKPDTKTPGKGSDAKKGGNSEWMGWAFLGLTVAGIAYMIYSVEKKSKETTLLLRSMSHPNLK